MGILIVAAIISGIARDWPDTFAILAIAPAVFAFATLAIGILEWRGRVRAAA